MVISWKYCPLVNILIIPIVLIGGLEISPIALSVVPPSNLTYYPSDSQGQSQHTFRGGYRNFLRVENITIYVWLDFFLYINSWCEPFWLVCVFIFLDFKFLIRNPSSALSATRSTLLFVFLIIERSWVIQYSLYYWDFIFTSN